MSYSLSIDTLVNRLELSLFVIPSKAGIQKYLLLMDPGFSRGDGLGDFFRNHQHC
jgi:hypothetical protein